MSDSQTNISSTEYKLQIVGSPFPTESSSQKASSVKTGVVILWLNLILIGVCCIVACIIRKRIHDRQMAELYGEIQSKDATANKRSSIVELKAKHSNTDSLPSKHPRWRHHYSHIPSSSYQQYDKGISEHIDTEEIDHDGVTGVYDANPGKNDRKPIKVPYTYDGRSVDTPSRVGVPLIMMDKMPITLYTEDGQPRIAYVQAGPPNTQQYQPAMLNKYDLSSEANPSPTDSKHGGKGIAAGTRCQFYTKEVGDTEKFDWYEGEIISVEAVDSSNNDPLTQIVMDIQGNQLRASSNSENLIISNGEHKENIPFRIFKQQQRGCKRTIEKCQCLERIIYALKYYDTLDMETDYNKLIDFCQITYKGLLNDYIHVIDRHNDSIQLEQISNLLYEMYEFKVCDIDKCGKQFKYRKGPANEGQKVASKFDLEPRCKFYKELLDQIHCYLYHQFDLGLRVRPSRQQNIGLEPQYSISNNNKFNIISDDTGKTDDLFMDGLYDHLSNMNLSKVVDMLKYEEYDTEALLDDVPAKSNADLSQSNINVFTNNSNHSYTISNLSVL